MIRLKKILSTPFASLICFLFAVANRIIFTTLNSLIGTDTKIQLTYTENLLAGNGMGVTKYFTTDLTSPVFDTQQIFPPGFSLAIIPFLKLFGGNEYRAVLAYDIIVAILFVIVMRMVGKKVGLSLWMNNIITLVAGCSQYLFFSSWSSTDAISLCLVLISLIVTIDIISKKEETNVFKVVWCGLLFCLPFFFRYMYLSIAVLLPFLVVAYGGYFKNKILKASGIKLFISSVFFLAIIFYFNMIVSGNALFVQDFGRGIFVDQLIKWYPFLPASFINLDFAAQLTEKISNLSYSRFMLFMEIMNPVLLVVFLALLWRYVTVLKKNEAFSKHFLFITIGSVVSIIILVLLAYLTLTYKAIPWGFLRWTHAQHARYFAFIYVFIPLALFVCLHHYAVSFKKLVARIFVFIALCSIAIEALHGVYYNVKIIAGHKDLAIIRDADKGYRNFEGIITKIKKKFPDRELMVSSPDQFYLHAASQMGYKAVFDYDNLWQKEIKVSSKSILLVSVHEQEAIIMKDYIEKRKPQLIATIAGTYFYTEELNPR